MAHHSYEIPNDEQKDSSQDPPIDDTLPQEPRELAFVVVESGTNHGKLKLVDNGFPIQ